MLKGISPLIASVLLIAFTIAVAGIISTWVITFSRTQTERVGREAEREVYCAWGGIQLYDLKYCSTTSSLSGKIENTGNILLGKIKINIALINGTILNYPLCKVDNEVISCITSNLTLDPSDIVSFNLTSSSNYDFVRVSTNCTNVDDRVRSIHISLSC